MHRPGDLQLATPTGPLRDQRGLDLAAKRNGLVLAPRLHTMPAQWIAGLARRDETRPVGTVWTDGMWPRQTLPAGLGMCGEAP